VRLLEDEATICQGFNMNPEQVRALPRRLFIARLKAAHNVLARYRMGL
jgi:hypothetical protein